MSDGVSDAYRASNAADRFRKKWDKAQVEEILLTDLRKELQVFSEEQLLFKAWEESEWLKVNYEKGWRVQHAWGEHFTTSIASSEADKWPNVKRYMVDVGNSFGVFREYVLADALIDAILFRRWLKTPEGKEAWQDYQDD